MADQAKPGRLPRKPSTSAKGAGGHRIISPRQRAPPPPGNPPEAEEIHYDLPMLSNVNRTESIVYDIDRSLRHIQVAKELVEWGFFRKATGSKSVESNGDCAPDSDVF